MVERTFQVLLIASFVAFSWLGFMVVHEFGHVIAGALSGATLSRIVLHPLQISWSMFAPNPHPQFVAWGGLVFGVLLPLALLALARVVRAPGVYLFQFFAGFCLVANGVYMLIDAFDRSGDAGTLLHHGASTWQILLFGVVATPLGFWLWNGLGRHFGIPSGRVSHGAALISVGLLVVTIAIELFLYKS
jgi:hypothetical protein